MSEVTPVRRKAAFIFILITVALDMLALGVMIPVLPELITQFEGGDISRAAAVGRLRLRLGLDAIPVSARAGIALRPFRTGRPVVLASNLGLGLDYIFMALAPSLPVLFIGRLISGATAASFSTAGA